MSQTATLYSRKRLEVCTAEEIEHCEKSQWIRKYIEAKKLQSPNTAKSYKTRLQALSQCAFQNFQGISFDQFIADVKADKHDPYDVLTVFVKFLQQVRGLKANEVRAFTVTARKFMRYCKVPIVTDDFKEQVPLPRKEKAEKKGIEKSDVVRYLNGCKNIQLKTALHVLAATGPRPIEPCAVSERGVDLKSDPATITFPAKYSKMRRERTRPLTTESANQIRLWLQFKYRPRRTMVKENGRYVNKIFTPKPDPDSLLLAAPDVTDDQSTPAGLYSHLQQSFAELADMMDPEPDRKPGQRHKMTLKTFRDFIKSTISDLGHQDYSEWFIGHAGSTYYQKSEKERTMLFHKVEPYITYLDISGLEAHGQDMATKIQELEAQLVKERKDSDFHIREVVGQMMSHENIQRYFAKASRDGAEPSTAEQMKNQIKEMVEKEIARRLGKKVATDVGQDIQ